MNRKERNRRLADIYYGEVMNGGKVDRIPDIIGEDFVFTIPTHPEVFRGVEGFRKEVSGLHGAFPDVHLDVHHLWCFDDLILGLWTGTGTHIGTEPLSTPHGPVPATWRPFSIEGVSWIRADGEMLRENLANEDTARIVHALGLADLSPIYLAAEAALVQGAQIPQAQTILPGLMANGVKLNHPLLLSDAIGSGQAASFFSAYWQAFDDVNFRITHGKRGDGVNAYRWEFQANHVRSFFGLPATGRHIHHQGVTVCVTDTMGCVTEIYVNENLSMLLPQVTPSPSDPR